jgi:hypothetical protein
MVGGRTVGGVLPGEEVIPELVVPVLVVVSQRLGEISDAAAYLCIQLRSRRWRQRNRHPGTVEVLAMGEADVMVVTLWLDAQSYSHSSSGT